MGTNTKWSTFVQRAGTLHLSRGLRFSDEMREIYTKAFNIDTAGKILEIGCGTGALAQALHRWYPNAEITGADTDTAFIKFSREAEPAVRFVEEDARNLSFDDETFDTTISNTVAEHIEPSAFFGEQLRVLKQGGVCLVLSSRREINIASPCIAKQSEFEEEIWQRAEKRMKEYERDMGVCLYPMSESEYPAAMEKYGFRRVSTEYITVNLTPDNPENSRESALAMINANRQTAIDGADILFAAAPDLVKEDEIAELKRLINLKYDERIALYDTGIKQWDTSVSLTMILRGIK